MNQNIINQSMIKSARTAGKILKSAFNTNTTKEESKSSTHYDVVSKVDIDSEKAILKILDKALPEINILSEEAGFINRNSTDTIVVDPLDGSSNFLLGIPHFSVALVHLHNGYMTASVVYNPILNKLYFAEKGKGSYLNDKKLKIQTKRKTTYLTVNFGPHTLWNKKSKFFDKAYKAGFDRVLNNWSPNLDYCLLAEGKVDAVRAEGSLIYDFAPGFLVAKEAGCVERPKMKKIDISGDFSMSFVIANKKALIFA